jgi:purine-binding chemotaxis protein CheW
VQALLVPLRDDWYAIELTRVREVVRTPEPTPVPGAPPALVGVFNLHGDVVPLFDLAALLGVPRGEPGPLVAIAETGGGPAGLLLHGRPEIAELDGDHRGAALLDIDFLLAEPAP